MNPKDKARFIYTSFNVVVYEDGLRSRDFIHKSIIKMCIVCVDEIIKANPGFYMEDYDGVNILRDDVAYWQQVKEELKKM